MGSARQVAQFILQNGTFAMAKEGAASA